LGRKKMKLWLDDAKKPDGSEDPDRRPPAGYDIWCRTEKQAIWALQNYPVTHISFDNDLGEGFGEGAHVAAWIEEQAFNFKIKPMTWKIHSGNAARWDYIRKAMENAERFWKGRKLREVNDG
jgi:hypothetical protein